MDVFRPDRLKPGKTRHALTDEAAAEFVDERRKNSELKPRHQLIDEVVRIPARIGDEDLELVFRNFDFTGHWVQS